MQSSKKLQQMEDETLCMAAAAGDREAEGLLISRYLGMVHKLAYQHRGILDFEDLVQEGCIGLLNAIGGFDPGHDARFSSYAYICVRNRIYRALRQAGGSPPPLPLEEDVLTAPDPEQLFLDREALGMVLEQVEERLSPLEKKVFFAHLAGFDYQHLSTDYFPLGDRQWQG